MTYTPNKFYCHIAKDYHGYFWQAECDDSVLVGYSFKGVSNAVASCNKYMNEHNFEWVWVTK